MTDPKVAIIGPKPPLSLNRYARRLISADRLSEYDLLVYTTAATGLGLTARGFTQAEVSQVQAMGRVLGSRHDEFVEFLGLGGVAVILLEVPGGVKVAYGDFSVHAAQLAVWQQYRLANMRIVTETGTSFILLDPNDPIALYLRELKRWELTLAGGGLADDPHGYPLATNRAGTPIAYVEHVGRGTVYWVPPPRSEEDWTRLLAGARTAWSEQFDPLLGLMGDELTTIDKRLDEKKVELGQAIRGTIEERNRVLASRRRLVESDASVERALQHYRAARRSSPARALDFLHRMIETIEHEYGGQGKTIETLGYSRSTNDNITQPANNRAYRARHEGGEGKPVPADELKKAFVAADEIMSRFLAKRLSEMKAGWIQPVSAKRR